MRTIEVTNSIIEELVQLIKTIAAIPAPSGQEDKRADFVKHYLEEAGYEQVILDEAKNVIVEVTPAGTPDTPIADTLVESPAGTPVAPIADTLVESSAGAPAAFPIDTPAAVSAPTLHLYTAHTDVVFPDTTPLPVKEEEGRLCAPGVGDDTANLAGMLLAMKYIRAYSIQHHLTPRRPIAYVADSGEEGLGNLRGMRAAYSRYAGDIARHIAFDGNTDVIVNRAVGSDRYEITVQTEGGHSYNAFGNRNAIAVASEMISALYQTDTEALPGKTTYNVGTIQGGTSVNTIAQQATFCYEYRSDEQAGLRQMKEIAQDKINRVLGIPQSDFGEPFRLEDGATVKAQDATVSVKVIGKRPGMGPVDEKAQRQLSDHLSDLLEKNTGQRPFFTSGSTDCNIPLSEGIPSACFGIYLGQGAHTREEYIELGSLKAGLQTMFDLMLEDYEEEGVMKHLFW
ncbi:MAG: M20/M25/M40 family metallo-hydrolase [Lachnospiraceae bacterium]